MSARVPPPHGRSSAPRPVDMREVVVRHREEIYRYARWLSRSDADAEDLAQTALVRVLERAPQLADPEAAKWYVLRVVRNLATDQARARARVTVEPRASLPEVLSGEGHPEERVLQAVEEALSRVAMAHLPACHQEVLSLRFLEGLGYPALARRLDTSEHAARQRVYRAVQALRTVMTARAFRPS